MSAPGSGLDGLFEEGNDVLPENEDKTQEPDATLAELFEENDQERPGPAEEQDLSGLFDAAEEPARQDAPTVHFKAQAVTPVPESPVEPGEGPAAEVEAGPEKTGSTLARNSEAEPKSSVDPEKKVKDGAPAQPPVSAATAEQRDLWRSEMDRLWPSVERVLRIAGSAVALDPVRKGLQLTQDPREDLDQREALMRALRPEIASSSASEAFSSREDIEPVTRFVYDEVLGISVLGDLWRDPEVTEIMVDSWDRIVVERNGRLHLTERSFRNPEHASSIARSLALRISDRAVSNAIPLVTAELPQARVSIAYGPVVKGGLSITIRKFKKLLGLEGLRELEALDDDMVHFLEKAVRARATILVSGGTGAGKTTIINLLSAFVPPEERVITIEDAFELQLSNTHVVSLQTKEAASADDNVSVTLADLLRSTLRMRPDRIVVGEIREPEAAEVMLAAANTGHAGTMTTIHANSASAALNERMVDLLLQMRPGNEPSVRRTIAEAFDIVVQVSRARDGSRYISEIALVTGASKSGIIGTVPLFTGTGDLASRHFAKETPPPKAQETLDRLLG